MSRSNGSGAGSKADKAQQILQQVLALPGNKFCAECGARQPRWASSNLGVLICLECSGVHRNLGVHISKVKSVSLDSWTVEGATQMLELGGNTALNQKYEAHIPADRQKPNESTSRYSVEQFIRDKWERQLFTKQRSSPASSPRHRNKVDAKPARVVKQQSGYDSNTATDVSVTSDSDADSLASGPSERASTTGRRVRRTANQASAKKPSSKQTVASIIPDLGSLDLMSSPASNGTSSNPSAASQPQAQAAATDSWTNIFASGNDVPASSAQPSFGFSDNEAAFPTSSSSSAAVSNAAVAHTRKATSTQSILDLYSTGPAAAAPQPQMQPYPQQPAQYGYGQPPYQQPTNGYPPMQMPYQPNGMYPQHPTSPQHQSPQYNNMGMYPSLHQQPQSSYGASGPGGSPQWSAFATANGHQQPPPHMQPPPANDMFFASAAPQQSNHSAPAAAAAKPDLFADLASMSFGSAAPSTQPTKQKAANGYHAQPTAAANGRSNEAFLDLLG